MPKIKIDLRNAAKQWGEVEEAAEEVGESIAKIDFGPSFEHDLGEVGEDLGELGEEFGELVEEVVKAA